MTTIVDAARAAVPFGLATVDLHRILVRFALDSTSPEYKAPLNDVSHAHALADPGDRTVVNLNVDTPYSYAWLDLRTGPVLLTMPPHEHERYMSAQVVDLYTYIVGYVSPRTVGEGGGTFLVRGPSTPVTDLDVDGVLECPTDLALVLVRTQLFDDADLLAVTRLQDAVRVEPIGPPGPDLRPPAPVDVRRPLTEGFLVVLDWMLRLMPCLPEHAGVRDELLAIGCGTGAVTTLLADPAARAEAREGLALGMDDVRARCATVRSSAEIFGSRELLADDSLSRAAGAVLGILGNAAEEYLGVGYRADSQGRPFDGHHDYRIRLEAGALPPVDAFWSITLYDAEQHLYANELDRYVLGSRQLPTLLRDADGSVTVHVRHERPASGLVPNWLPAPAAPFGLAFRTYLPRAAIRTGAWTAPPVRRTT